MFDPYFDYGSFREEDMYPYVRRNLRKKFPASAGWNIYEKDRWRGYEPDFVVERRYRGKVERIVVEVKLTCRVTRSHISQLKKYVRNLSGRNAIVKEKILVVPSGSDTSIVPHDVTVIFLKSFKCEDDEIVWYE
ncbi:hypothetical protein DRO97_06475 [Archaeoglobales archaeon]|nr:MAG: hypothetical protein DRO97_06475 [Archaeoglobales archaeon]